MQFAASQLPLTLYTNSPILRDRFGMSKKYVSILTKRSGRTQAVMQGFVLGLADFGSFGTRLFDLAGYPYEDEAEALQSDWVVVGDDMWQAVNKCDFGPNVTKTEHNKTNAQAEQHDDL